ncbi:2-amino-4-hydroxy-6-hydroxymethyldihydropteridine diphosphokinase [Planktosalinus lacus]|uniref:2-amino-4-hydroxy-6-hydroxymethyldihydropteridine pyrophosphokinase n=1 Tax=Planktosalinus lacus TaxID=1526573 RepID=A0A8J2Y9X1_9FLAO|nr:2-amino-4-hydroxy-6-hydroxymethyldihydropteridine diphosphokinase [Planktosalinus lacus]GGE01585.1 2-amino-4-hydroxy-6-hydroxymethyldihydropteridine diphosphokinase [Planktosalinus lacus]
MNQHKTYISLGSNVGDTFQNLQRAVDLIYEDIGSILKISPVYETASWGFEADDFLNAVILVQTRFSPKKVLRELLIIENKLGRLRNEESGYQSRSIDLDILYYDEEVLDSENLQLPHPHIHKRRFVLQPLVDIAAKLMDPVQQKNAVQLLEDCEDDTKMQKIQRWLKNPIINNNLSRFNYVAIEGNIGAGKTTLAETIATDFNAKLVLERFADNPFLPKFYKDKSRFAFPLEMSFLADRYQQVHDDLGQLDLFKDFIVADYDIYKSLIFAKVTLQEEEYKLYRRLFELMYKDIKRPELYVFLFQSTDKLIENIQKRGRKFEQNISAEYLDSLQKGYLDFIKSQTENQIKIIDITEMDFVKNRSDYLEILRQISLE